MDKAVKSCYVRRYRMRPEAELNAPARSAAYMNPAGTGRNRNPSASRHQSGKAHMSRKRLLDGIWDFAFFTTPLNEFSPDGVDYNSLMSVPGCFDTVEPYRLEHGLGVYRRRVAAAGNVRLTVGGLGLRARIFWDGRELGAVDTPFMTTQYYLDAGAAGEHELVIAVENVIDDTPGSQFHRNYDFYAYGGIFRSVTLEEFDAFCIDRVQVTPLDTTAGTVEVRLEIGGGFPDGATVEFDFDGAAAGEFPLKSPRQTFELAMSAFQLWSPEHPHLHTLNVRVGSETAAAVFGMRTVTAAAGEILLNGRPLKLVGYCRHDCHPQFGYAVPEHLVLADLMMIREQGCNFIRGSHYPQSETVLDLCDRLGILVWNESIGWGNRPEVLGSELFRERQCEQTRAMVRYSCNHPSVILWGFLNEADTRAPESVELVRRLCAAIREEDRSRLITYASMYYEADLCLDQPDVISFNLYPGWYDSTRPGLVHSEKFNGPAFREELERFSRIVSAPEHRDKPFIFSEIGAAAIPGDHSGQRWSEEYQAAIDTAVVEYVLGDHRPCGVALWQFCDTKTYSDFNAVNRPRGFNNKGVVDEYRRPKFAWRELGRLLAGRSK